mmetsp:Transcript_56811/g.116330  ORF Transcript_56811/g.116330 Transcript_56811/m.116330 type:complete len:690 (+) Transcript_56811:284-2353(+)|eukprot:CAMPEP_0181307852 /NCGR_PEP_ID=MMETSP1101-20121128/11120_1 /TAXON_ID=46948 /ORGANISM="Rhodomonas abbreviata, Strain Caron Lab Isolate" /LENGTH=689 /DNA_ID=CAMNT_0023414135 /DNA_START=192 /DNA_END=2261 /DNA_ORIENTATION=+
MRRCEDASQRDEGLSQNVQGQGFASGSLPIRPGLQHVSPQSILVPMFVGSGRQVLGVPSRDVQDVPQNIPSSSRLDSRDPLVKDLQQYLIGAQARAASPIPAPPNPGKLSRYSSQDGKPWQMEYGTISRPMEYGTGTTPGFSLGSTGGDYDDRHHVDVSRGVPGRGTAGMLGAASSELGHKVGSAFGNNVGSSTQGSAGARGDSLQQMMNQLSKSDVASVASRGRAPFAEEPPRQSWFVIVVDEMRQIERGYKLHEIFGPIRPDNSCTAKEWRRVTDINGITFDSQTFVNATSYPAQIILPAGMWIPVRTFRGRARGSNGGSFLMVEREAEMVQQLYNSATSDRSVSSGTAEQGLGATAAHERFPLLKTDSILGEAGPSSRASHVQSNMFSHNLGAHISGGGSGGGSVQDSGSGGNGTFKGTFSGEKRSANFNSMLPLSEGHQEGKTSKFTEQSGPVKTDSDRKQKRAKGIEKQWRCDVCNIIFSSSQALGGHRINSTDHKQNLLRRRRLGPEESLPTELLNPRYSKDVYSNPAPESSAGGRRVWLPSMAQMPGFLRVLRTFPPEVGTDICVSQSPTAYFSSCRLELFKRHHVFGAFGGLIIERYFTETAATFEAIITDPTRLPELAEVGLDGSNLTEEQLQDLKVFLRMLRTKKKSLDINRRAVSKRIKGIRQDVQSKLDTGGSSQGT